MALRVVFLAGAEGFTGLTGFRFRGPFPLAPGLAGMAGTVWGQIPVDNQKIPLATGNPLALRSRK
jgi:hypothetical protein